MRHPGRANVCSPLYTHLQMPPNNAIVVSGAREHNLRDVSLTLPRRSVTADPRELAAALAA